MQICQNLLPILKIRTDTAQHLASCTAGKRFSGGSKEPKHLSTRFVTMEEKVIHGRCCWLRARYVAREYAWLSPERQDLFSPASSNITNRLLPSPFLQWKKKCPEKRFTLAAIDIGDAFLTVPQVQPTLVSSGTETYALGRVLPGQRDGSQLWFESALSFCW